jgi:hypothetical protein
VSQAETTVDAACGRRRDVAGLDFDCDSDDEDFGVVYYEAWLLDSTSLTGPTLRMEALGALGRGTTADLTVADNLDLSAVNIVDISAEPHDGNAAHSGRSLLRGRLP